MDHDLTALTDVSVGSWIRPRLGPFGTTVGSVVPRGFEAYARILHPAGTHDRPTSWASVCSSTGRRPHGLMQWQDIAGPEWQGEEPDTGNLDPIPLEGLCDVLVEHTPPGAGCVFALWDGFGVMNGSPSIGVYIDDGTSTGATPHVSPAFGPDVMNGPRLHLPNRDYLVFTGPLRAAVAMGNQIRRERFVTQSPSLFWPGDRSWCVATEVDYDSTLVGGSAELVADVLAAAACEAWAIGPDDSLVRGN